MKNWVAIHHDRDFMTGTFGMGTYLYTSKGRCIIEGVSYESDKLIVKDQSGDEFELEGEPNFNEYRVVYALWEKWDEQYGRRFGDDDVDFIPWAYSSKLAVAQEFGLAEQHLELSFIKKPEEIPGFNHNHNINTKTAPCA